jgi:predicted nicotinamide N-methyase
MAMELSRLLIAGLCCIAVSDYRHIFVDALVVVNRKVNSSCRRASRKGLHLGAPSNSEHERKRRKIKLSSGNEARLLSRTVEIFPEWRITVWEWEKPAEVVDTYWQAQARIADSGTREKGKLLDPFGLVLWPGSVVAAQELKAHSHTVRNKNVLVLGAGVGVETQALAELGAKRVLATDVHPTTLTQLRLGVEENTQIANSTVVEVEIFDLFSEAPLPMPSADLIVVADVLYNEQLAAQMVYRLLEAWKRNPAVNILVTDSQRFVDFKTPLIGRLDEASLEISREAPSIRFTEKTLDLFTGSGVCIDDDQTYDVKVRKIWIGLDFCEPLE